MYLNLLNLVEINIVSIHNFDNYMIMFLACFPLCGTKIRDFSNLEYGENISWKLRVLNLCNVYNMSSCILLNIAKTKARVLWIPITQCPSDVVYALIVEEANLQRSTTGTLSHKYATHQGWF